MTKLYEPIAQVLAGRTAVHIARFAAHYAGQPIEALRENLDIVDWKRLSSDLSSGLSQNFAGLAEDYEQLERLPFADIRVMRAMHEEAQIDLGISLHLMTAAIMAGNRRALLDVRNAIYSEIMPRIDHVQNDLQPAEGGGMVRRFYSQQGTEIHPARFIRERARQTLYTVTIQYIDTLLGDKQELRRAQETRRLALSTALSEPFMRTFALAPTVITSENIAEFYPEVAFTPQDEQAPQGAGRVEFAPDIILDKPILAGAEGQGEQHQTAESSVAETVRKSLANAYVDPERLAVLEEVKNWDQNAKSVGAVMGGPGTRRVRDDKGELVEDKYFGVVTPIYAKESNAVIGYGLVADSVVANRRKFVVYRSDVGGLPWEEVATMSRSDALKIPGVRAFTHTKVGDKTIHETTQEKIFYLLTCTPEEYVVARFSGEDGKGGLSVRLGSSAVKPTVEKPE